MPPTLQVADVFIPFFVQDVVQRVGSKGPLAEFARGLCARLAPQLLSAQHVAELLRAAGAQAEEPLDEPFLAGMLKLLVDTSVAAPALFTNLSGKVGLQCWFCGCRGYQKATAPQLLTGRVAIVRMTLDLPYQSAQPAIGMSCVRITRVLVSSIPTPMLHVQVLALLEDEGAGLAEGAAQILAHAGPAMRSEITCTVGVLARAKQRLLSLCKEGTPKAAKAAVRCALL